LDILSEFYFLNRICIFKYDDRRGVGGNATRAREYCRETGEGEAGEVHFIKEQMTEMFAKLENIEQLLKKNVNQ
jgi:hypothetical protein